MSVKEDVALARQWLAKNSPGFRETSNDVKVGISYFVMVWSLFDFRYLGARGKLRDVLYFIEYQVSPDLDVQPFLPHLSYFRDRYLDGNQRNYRLDALAWNDYQSGDRIENYLCQLEPSAQETVGGLLLISYRLRCNLIHESKWENGLADQYENFQHSTKAMMMLMDHSPN